MIKQFIATAAIAVFGFASTASAHHVPNQPFVQAESELLLEAVVETGHRVAVDAPICQKPGLLGAATSRRALIICEQAHGGNLVELADTIRHEAIHLIQYCKGRNGGATIATLYPEHAEDSVRYAVEVLHFGGQGYESHQIVREAEARALAHVWDETEIADQLRRTCSID